MQQCYHVYMEQEGVSALPTSLSTRPDQLCRDCGDVQEEVVQQRGLFYLLDHCTMTWPRPSCFQFTAYVSSYHLLPVPTYYPLTYSQLVSLPHNLCWRHNYCDVDQLTQKPVIAIWCMLSFTHFSTISIQSRPSCSSLRHFLSSLYRSKSCN